MASLVLDLSNNNANPNFRSIARWRSPAGDTVRGVMLKVSEGVTFTDGVFKDWSQRARRNGLAVGGYHFAQPNGGDAVAEAKFFAEKIGKIQDFDFRPALDLEANAGDLSWSQLVAWSRTFNQEFFKQTGTLPLFYASRFWINSFSADVPIGAGLWLAHWSKDGKPFQVTAPAPWKKVVLHQFTSEAPPIDRSPLHPAGVPGRVDINRIVIHRPMYAFPEKVFDAVQE